MSSLRQQENFQFNKSLLKKLSSEINHNNKYFSFHDLCRDIKLNLENILNTRNETQHLVNGFKELSCSLINYGMNDLSCGHRNIQAEQSKICDDLAKAISVFEPRLSHIQVDFLYKEDSLDRTYKLRIEGILNEQFLPASFESNYSLSKQRFIFE